MSRVSLYYAEHPIEDVREAIAAVRSISFPVRSEDAFAVALQAAQERRRAACRHHWRMVSQPIEDLVDWICSDCGASKLTRGDEEP